MGNDISNLLSKFGATVDGYLEVEAAINYKEPARKAKVPPVVVQKTESGVTAVEPATGIDQAEPAPVPAASTPAPVLESQPVAAPQRIEPVIEPLAAPASEPQPAPLAETAQPPVAAQPAPAAPVAQAAPVAEVAPALKLAPAEPKRAAAVPQALAPAVPISPATTSDPAVPTLLRSMLGDAARERQAQQRSGSDAPGQSALTPPPSTPAQVIAVVSPKGGVGKTTLCSALACSLARHGRVIAVDLDPQNALQYHLGVSTEAATPVTLPPFVADWRDGLLSGMAGTQVVNHALVASAGEAVLAQQMAQDGQWLMRRLQAMQLQAGDVVLLDLPAGQTAYFDQALQAADQVLAVVTPDAGSFLALEHMRQALHGRNNCRYVVNKYDASRSFCQDMLEVLKRWMGPRLAGVIALDHAISEGLAYGFNPLIKASDSPVYDQLQGVSEVLRVAAAKARAAGGRA